MGQRHLPRRRRGRAALWAWAERGPRGPLPSPLPRGAQLNRRSFWRDHRSQLDVEMHAGAF